MAVRDLIPDGDPFRAWANLEFVADDGSANEVDLLVLARNGLHLIELKHWQGKISGDGTTWLHNGHPVDSPLLLTNRKAKRLRSLLQRVARDKGSKTAIPFVKASVLLHAPGTKVQLSPTGRTGVYGLDSSPCGLDKIGEDLITAPPRDSRDMIDAQRGRALAKLLDQAGIRRSVSSRTVGTVLVDEDVLAEGPGWQDYVGRHTSLEGIVRRVRFYLVDRAASRELRTTIQRAARREFSLLEGISHPGISRAVDFVDHERGPAVVFETDPGEVRLDHFLAQRGSDLTIDEQLQIMRTLAETIRYAHARRLVHRALNPRAIAVRKLRSGSLGVRVQDWQTGGRGSGSNSRGSSNPGSHVTGTQHLEALVDVSAAPYVAPEAYTNPLASGTALDVFSLGAIAFHVFTSLPPAADAQELLHQLKGHGGGLDVTSALDGAPKAMRDLVFEATYGDVDLRTETVNDFLKGLTTLESDLTAPDVGEIIDPLDAQPGDIIGGRFHVVDRLGAGSTARALLVNDTTRTDPDLPVVLKIALDEDKADRLRSEAEVLGEVRERRVVALIDGPLTVGGRTALLLEDAGRESLSDLLRREGRLSIDLLERWGRDLLEVTQALDDVGVNHRDVKPDNLAYGEVGKKHRRIHLRLFDFSLSRAPLDQTNAGTPPYLDPFFDAVKRPRWDAAAERYAVAVTLFEMATGAVPVYGSGESHPTQVDDEAYIDAQMFEPAVADGLVAFFRRALRRDPKQRFDTLSDMAQSWAGIFAAVPAAASQTTGDPVPGDERDALAAAATLDTPLTESGLTPRAVSAFDKYDVATVGDLLALGGYETSKIARVSEATRKEIRRRVKQWRERLSVSDEHIIEIDVEPESDEDAAAVANATARSVDAILARLVPKATARNETESRATRLLLGMADPAGGESLTWPTQSEVANRLSVSSPRVAQVAAKARARWSGDAALTGVTEDVVRLVSDSGGVMGAFELARSLLVARGSVADEPRRTSQAVGLVRAAVEVEQERGGESRLDFRRTPGGVTVAHEPDDPTGSPATELLDHAVALGRVASDLAAEDPLPNAARCLERLRTVTPPEGVAPLDDTRLPKVAAGTSASAAANSRGEVYPIGLAPVRALSATASALSGGGSVGQIQESLRSRFPEAAPLPARPELDGVLRRAGLLLTWDGLRYAPPSRGESSVFHTRTRVIAGTALPVELADIESRLVTSLETAAFLTIAVDPQRLDEATAALVARFGVTPYDVTRELLAQMRREAETGQVVWDVVLRADRPDAPAAAASRLRQLVNQAAKPVERHLAEAPEPLLITAAEPLARYGRLTALEELADRPTRRPEARWLLLPAEGGGTPKLDGKPAPISSGWLRLPNDWIKHASTTVGRAS